MGVVQCLNPQTIQLKNNIQTNLRLDSLSCPTSPIQTKIKPTRTFQKCKPLPSLFNSETPASKKEDYKIIYPIASISSKPSLNSIKSPTSHSTISKLSNIKTTSRSLNIDSVTLTEENIEPIHSEVDDLFIKDSVNVLIMSSPGCGSTSLGYRIAAGKFSKVYIPSIGIEIKHRFCEVRNKIKNMNIVILPSDGKIKENYSKLFTLCSICFIVYDVMNEESFNQAKEIYEREIESRKGTKLPIVVFIGNKIDLISGNNESSFIDKVKLFCDNQSICNYLVSAKTAKGIRILMESVLKKLTT